MKADLTPTATTTASQDRPVEGESLSGRSLFDEAIVVAGACALAVAGLWAVIGMFAPLEAAHAIVFVLLWAASSFAWHTFRKSQGKGAGGISAWQASGGAHGAGKQSPETTHFSESSLSELGSWEWDIVSNRLKWSDEVYAIFGIQRTDEPPTYEKFLKSIHPEDRLFVEESVSRCLREKIPYAIDYRIICPGGEVKVVYEQNEVEYIGDRPVGMSGTVCDVTERRKAESDLKSRYGLLKMLIEAIPIPVFQKNESGLYRDCNKAFENFFGYSRAEIIGKTVFDLTPKETAIKSDNIDKALQRQGGTQTYESVAVDSKGERHHVIFHKAALMSEDGKYTGLIGTMLDISDRKRMEAALRESEQRFRNIAESSSDWFWETDADHRFSYLSERAENVLGILPEMALGKTRMNLTDAEEIARNTEKWAEHARVLDEHEPFRDFDYPIVTPNGSRKNIKISGVPVFNEDGVFTGYRGTGTDISAQKRVERALRQSEERHRHFAADVAHELRTPLAVLRTHLDNICDISEAASLRDDVDSMSRMVGQLLAATRIETYATEDTFEDVDLLQVCRSIATLLAPIAIKEQRSIEVTGSEIPIIVRGNPDSLEQAVRNLVENAIRYSARGTIITLDLEADPVPTFRIIDRGRGIPKDQREEIFERFLRADRRKGGAGLGLSIVKRTLEQHKASVRIEDTPGGGATFIVTFPAQ